MVGSIFSSLIIHHLCPRYFLSCRHTQVFECVVWLSGKVLQHVCGSWVNVKILGKRDTLHSALLAADFLGPFLFLSPFPSMSDLSPDLCTAYKVGVVAGLFLLLYTFFLSHSLPPFLRQSLRAQVLVRSVLQR